MGRFKLSNFLQLKYNIFLYRLFGWGLARVYIFILGKIYFLIKRDEKLVIEKSVRDVVKMMNREKETDQIVKKVFKGILSHYYEKFYIAFEKKDKAVDFLSRKIASRDISIIRRSLDRGNGVILITGHYGAIEFIPTLLAVKNVNISMIAKFKTEQLRKKIFNQAQKYNIRMLDAEKSGNVLKKAISELKQNRVLVTQCDEIDEWRPSENKRTSFLGQVTGLDRTVNVIQKRSGAEVLFGIIHRHNLFNYELIVYSYDDMLKMLKGNNRPTPGEAVLKVLEQYIYRYPEQWYQWKKYPQLCGYKIPGRHRGGAGPRPVLQPLLERHV